MSDFRKSKSIGTSNSVDIKCSSTQQMQKVLFANFYPCIDEEVYYYDTRLGIYTRGKVLKYKTPTTMILKDCNNNEVIFTLKKDGGWTEKRDKGLYNPLDIKLFNCLKEID